MLPIDPAQMPHGMQFDLPKPKGGGGMFGGGGGKFGLKEALAFGLAGFMSRRNPMLLQGLMGAMMQKQQGQREEQQYQRQRMDGRDDFLWKQEHTPHQPDPMTQMMLQAGIDPNSDKGKALYLQALQNKANPFVQMRVQNPDGSESLQFMRPPSTPSAPVGGLMPIEDEGGPAAPPPATFPY